MSIRALAPRRQLIAASVAALFVFAASTGAEAGCNKAVTLYDASWCPYCKQVREILARNHIEYRRLDATKPSVQAAMRERFGDTSVPRTVIGGVVVEGVDEDRIKTLCSQRSIEPAPLPPVVDIKLSGFPLRHNAGKREPEQEARFQPAVSP